MAKKLMHLKHIAPDGKSFHFEVLEDPKYLPEWQARGIDIQLICNTVPTWVPRGWVRPWCVAQDIFNFQWFRGDS